MRVQLFSLLLIGIIGLTGCLSSDADCNQEDAFTNQELFFLIDDLGNNYLSFGPTLDSAIPICDQDIVPQDSLGIENIYNVDGAIVGDCRAPGCVTASTYRKAYCELEIPASEEDFELLGRWRIAYFEKNNVRFHPSCLQLSENLIFGTNADSTVFQVLSAFAFSNLIADFTPRSGNLLRLSDVIADAAEGPVYLELFERSILEFFQTTEAMTYEIRRNIMTLHMANDNTIVLFANP